MYRHFLGSNLIWLKVNQQISSCQYCINLIKYKITVGSTRSMLMDGRKSSTEKPKSMKNWRWYLIFLLVLMNFNMIVLINHLPFSLYLICWHWFQMELQELLQEVDKVMRDYSKVHMFGFFNFDHFQLLFCPSISIQMLYCCFLCQFRSLIIGYVQDQPYVGIPTRFEPFRDQLINMKVRMLTQCTHTMSMKTTVYRLVLPLDKRSVQWSTIFLYEIL